MTNIIKHKRSVTPGAVPTPEALSLGELAVNAADGKLFTRKADGTVVELTRPTVVDGGEIVYDSLLAGLQAFWVFDNNAGTVPDTSGNNRPLFLARPAERGTGVQATSLALTHRTTTYSDNAFSTRRTLAFWIKCTAAPAATTAFLSFGEFAHGENTARLSLQTDGKLNWVENINAAPAVVSNSALPANTWTHVTLVREPGQTTDTIKLYFNGVLSTTVSNVSATLIFNAADILTLGLFADPARIDIDCFGIWNRALTAAEIQRLHSTTYAPPAAPPTPIDPATFIAVSADAPITALAVSVSGSTGTLFPAFNSNVYDYGVLCDSSTPNAAVAYTLTINGVAVAGAGSVNKVIRVNFGSTAYYIRLLPADIPLGTVITAPSEEYIPGYYLTTSRRDVGTVNYNIVYDENGLPFWYNQTPGLPSLNEPGNDRNALVIGRRNGTLGPRYVLSLAANTTLARSYEFLSTTKNGNTYGPPTIDWQQHELIQLSSPPDRRGNIFTIAFPSAPTAGSQRITDKAYGIYIQEQTPTSGEIAWEWWTGDYFNQTAATQTSSFFHMNAADVHPINGDVLCSMRNCSALVCVDGTTRNVKWVLQGPPSTASELLEQVADPATTTNTKFLTLEGEPVYADFQYIGPCGQHHVRWCPHIEPLTPGNEIVTAFDNQTGFFAGGTANISPKTVTSLSQNGTLVTGVANAHGFTTGSYIQITGASPAQFNGIFVATSVNADTFTYTLPTADTLTATGTITAVRAQNYFPGAGPYARGVVYEIDLNANKAIHRASVFSNVGRSGYLGSYQIVLHANGEYSHVVDFNGQHPQLLEHSDAGGGVQPSENAIFAVDFPGDIYRILKVEKDFFDVDYLRSTIGLPLTPVTGVA